MKKGDNSRGSGRRRRLEELQDKVMEFLQSHSKQSFNYKQIAFGIGAESRPLRMDVINILDELAAIGDIVEVDLGRYKAKANRGTENIGYFVRRSNGKNAVVVGRSNIVGKPVAKLLLDENATVTIAHSRTPDLRKVTLEADILVVAVGKEGVVTGDMVKPGAVVIDVGMNRNAEGKLVGDVDFPSAAMAASWITPVPGGVGPMTIAMLMENTLECYLRKMEQ